VLPGMLHAIGICPCLRGSGDCGERYHRWYYVSFHCSLEFIMNKLLFSPQYYSKEGDRW